MAAAESSPVPASPVLGEALSALDAFTGEETDTFYAALDELPNFESPQLTVSAPADPAATLPLLWGGERLHSQSQGYGTLLEKLHIGTAPQNLLHHSPLPYKCILISIPEQTELPDASS